jgi:hypothetical protein
MERRGDRAPSGLAERAALILRALDTPVLRKLPKLIRISCMDWIAVPSGNVFFIWANERRKDRHLASLQGLAATKSPLNNA